MMSNVVGKDMTYEDNWVLAEIEKLDAEGLIIWEASKRNRGSETLVGRRKSEELSKYMIILNEESLSLGSSGSFPALDVNPNCTALCHQQVLAKVNADRKTAKAREVRKILDHFREKCLELSYTCRKREVGSMLLGLFGKKNAATEKESFAENRIVQEIEQLDRDGKISWKTRYDMSGQAFQGVKLDNVQTDKSLILFRTGLHLVQQGKSFKVDASSDLVKSLFDRLLERNNTALEKIRLEDLAAQREQRRTAKTFVYL